jgi:hypothetical protein
MGGSGGFLTVAPAPPNGAPERPPHPGCITELLGVERPTRQSAPSRHVSPANPVGFRTTSNMATLDLAASSLSPQRPG